MKTPGGSHRQRLILNKKVLSFDEPHFPARDAKPLAAQGKIQYFNVVDILRRLRRLFGPSTVRSGGPFFE
jgi:hypothetical protein